MSWRKWKLGDVVDGIVSIPLLFIVGIGGLCGGAIFVNAKDKEILFAIENAMGQPVCDQYWLDRIEALWYRRVANDLMLKRCWKLGKEKAIADLVRAASSDKYLSEKLAQFMKQKPRYKETFEKVMLLQ
jgi:hypothetical protein